MALNLKPCNKMVKIAQEIIETKYLRNGDIIHHRIFDYTPFHFSPLELFLKTPELCLFGDIISDSFTIFENGKILVYELGKYQSHDFDYIFPPDLKKVAIVKIYETNSGETFVKINGEDIPCSNRDFVLSGARSGMNSPLESLIGKTPYSKYIEAKIKRCIIL